MINFVIAIKYLTQKGITKKIVKKQVQIILVHLNNYNVQHSSITLPSLQKYNTPATSLAS